MMLLALALAAQTFSVEPAAGTLAVQQDGTCRGHIAYRVIETGVVDEDGAPIIETGEIEVQAPCARLTAITTGETFDTSGGKLTLTAPRAAVAKWFIDPDGNGPRVVGECDVVISVTASIRQRRFDVSRVRRAALCAPLNDLVANACWKARGSWHATAPFPAIPKCP